MRLKLRFFPLLLVLLPFAASAQVICDPVFPTASEQVTIYFDAAQGNGALAGNAGPVFAHMGLITSTSTSPSDWKYVPTTWGINDPVGAMQSDGPNRWKKTITINSFFNVPGGVTVLRMAFVFRNQAGTVVGRASDGGDIFYDVVPAGSPLVTKFLLPTSSTLLLSSGAPISINAAASQSATLRLLDNGVQVGSGSGKSLNTSINAGAAGVHKVEFIAETGSESSSSIFFYTVPGTVQTQEPPAGTRLGYTEISPTSIRFALYAPNKQVVHLMGDFNNWLPSDDFLMKRSADGATWWYELSGLTPGQTYRFQYLVNGTQRIADPLSTLVLDPGNDRFIPGQTFPNLPAYPEGQTSGTVSVFKTGQTPFSWTASNYQRPKKSELIVYEMLLRDFINAHDYQTLTDSLDYLERLGITAIQLMPINEFDGNISWGYNPSYHKAIDKYYGTPEALKTLIDECHKRNIAVIVDVVFNHVSGSSPLAQLYWDSANNRPAADNPWLNPVAKHDFNVFNDFNHDSQATRNYTKNCLDYWIKEFRVDGFRFDLSKGFTQKNTLGNVGAWGQYDAARIALWKEYSDFMWAIDPDFYVILEHFADNAEEKELAQYGMMLWGNMHFSYKDVALGGSAAQNTSLSSIAHTARGWAVPHLVGYMESHDEERVSYECRTYGSLNGTYNIKFLPIAMLRMEMMHNLLFSVPGPKMLWQFGELGYDFSINTCENGTISNDCRLSPKPIRWDFRNDPYRKRLFDVTSALLHLRKNNDIFETSDFTLGLGSGNLRFVRLNSANFNVNVIANIATSNQTSVVTFQHPGTWYEYYTGTTLNVPGVSTAISLKPGEYRLYTDMPVALPPGVNTTAVQELSGSLSGLEVFPNPVERNFTAAFTLSSAGSLAVEVRALDGHLVQQDRFLELPAGELRFDIDLSGAAPGTYLLLLRDAQGGVLTKKLIKL